MIHLIRRLIGFPQSFQRNPGTHSDFDSPSTHSLFFLLLDQTCFENRSVCPETFPQTDGIDIQVSK